MPNFGFWELAVVLIIVFVVWGWFYLIFGKCIPTIAKEIRRIWYDAKPDDHSNHR